MTSITREAVRIERLAGQAADEGHGAVATFVGTIRREKGEKVVAVTYDGFEPLAAKVLREIAVEAEQQWGARIAAAHRLGRLEVGEISVAIACGAPHRAEAFAACRYVIEEIKSRLPVWKKEHFEDGTAQWLEGHALETR